MLALDEKAAVEPFRRVLAEPGLDYAVKSKLENTVRRLLWGGNLTLSKIVEFKIHDVTKAYVEEMVKLGFKDLTPAKAVELKIHDIDKEYVIYCREILKGKKELTPERVLSMKINEI